MKFTTDTFFKIWFGFIALLIISIIALNVYKVSQADPGSLSVGLNGMTESRCIDGYKFIVGQDGQARQIMDSVGHGVQCTAVAK
jgi:hypothetical protein